MMIKNWKLFLGLSSVVMLAVAGLQGCSDSIVVNDGDSPSDAGAAGDTNTPNAGSGGASAGAAGVSGDAGDDGMGIGGEAGGSNEPLTQAELCEKFCTDEFDICTGDLQQYESLEDCAAACNQFARGTEGDTTGNTLDCRIYHLNAAATVSAQTHCKHTAAVAAAFCIDE